MCAGASAVFATGCLGTLHDESDSPSAPNSQNGSQDSLSRVGIKSIGWDGTTLVILFDPSFDEWDGWAIHHEYEDPERDRLTGGKYPRVDEPPRIPFVELLSRPIYGDVSTTTFQITPFNGYASDWDQYPDGVTAWTEWGTSVSFDAPERVIDEADAWSGES